MAQKKVQKCVLSLSPPPNQKKMNRSRLTSPVKRKNSIGGGSGADSRLIFTLDFGFRKSPLHSSKEQAEEKGTAYDVRESVLLSSKQLGKI